SWQIPVLRWLCLASLFLVELLALSFRFDTNTLHGLHVWWAELLLHAHVLPQVAIAIAAATFLVGGERLRHEMRQVGEQTADLAWWPFLLAHWAVLAGFTWLTAFVLEGDARLSSWGGA